MEAKNLEQTISFQVKTDSPGYEKNLIPWISIAYFDEDLPNLIDADEIVLIEKSVTILIDYPLNTAQTFTLKSNEGFTRALLIKEISAKYLEIFEIEDQTFNIALNSGKYGIWGHEFGELDLSSIEVYRIDPGKVELLLNIES
ncbi:MAG: hypothetical protein EOP00_11730 [Pedobacter sp.]|nr:MAG: hypothetical protein EOP00_11730 [Pedobacter sp.]